MLQVFHANVAKVDLEVRCCNYFQTHVVCVLIWMFAKVDLDVSLLQTSSFDVADICCWVLQTLNFNVADVEFRCCRHVRRRRELMMLVVARNMTRCFDDVATFCFPCFICYSNMLRHMHLNVSL
jgi:hypothetical protein